MVQLRTKDVNPNPKKNQEESKSREKPNKSIQWKNRPDPMSHFIQWKPVKPNVRVRFFRIYENQKFCVP
jgi:hypothetical protein